MWADEEQIHVTHPHAARQILEYKPNNVAPALIQSVGELHPRYTFAVENKQKETKRINFHIPIS